MFKFKIESDNLGNLKFRADISDDLKNNIIVKRVLFESRIVKSNKEYPYLMPIKYFMPMIKNLSGDIIEIDKDSTISFLEFSDEYEENYYYAGKASAKYMKKWREQGCPKIFKITIKSDFIIEKETVFERIM